MIDAQAHYITLSVKNGLKGPGKLYFVGFSTILLFTNREDEEQSPPAARLTPKRSGVVSNPTGQFKKIMLKERVCNLIYGRIIFDVFVKSRRFE